jgi:hypothetical protein
VQRKRRWGGRWAAGGEDKPVSGEKEYSVSSINRRPGLSGEMQVQLEKVTAFEFSFVWLERASRVASDA